MIKSFKLGAVNWKVKIDNKRLEDLDALGYCEYEKKLISLPDKYKGATISADAMEQTLYHEVVHAILDTMHQYDLSKNEEFVQTFSMFLHQFEKTKSNSSSK